ncbi:MAG: tRNA-uridine aminocarboxypropyltransferase [Clostridiaceae bacterium]
MNKALNIKRITTLYHSCNKCGLPEVNCICSEISKIKTRAKIWILSTEKEFYRPSNTARLIKLVNEESTEIFLWERTKIPKKLIDNLNNEIYEPYLLFPAEDEETINRKVDYSILDGSIEKIPVFIIIDGTWKEAKKIFKRSEYLRDLPIISLEPNFKSEFDLRKGADSNGLCTIEAAIEVLKLNMESESSKVIYDFYKLFLRSFKAGLNGHKLK